MRLHRIKYFLPLFLLIFSCDRHNGFGRVGISNNEDKKLLLWLYDNNSNIYENIKYVITKFNKENPDITINIQQSNSVMSKGEYIDGDPFDLSLNVTDRIAPFIKSGFITPGEDLFSKDLFLPDVASFITFDKKMYGVPLYFGNHLMLLYNKDLIKTPPKTTSELFQFCESYKGKNCIEFNQEEPYWFVPFFTGFGASIFDQKNKINLNTPEMIKALDLLALLKDKKYVSEKCFYDCMDNKFISGKMPMIINGDWSLALYAKSMKSKLGVALLPIVSETGLPMKTMVSGKYFFVTSSIKGEKLKVIKKLLNAFINSENQIRVAREQKLLPTVKAIYSDNEFASLFEKDDVLYNSYKQTKNSLPMPIDSNMDVIWAVMRNQIKNLLENRISSKNAAQAMQEELEKYLD